MNEVHHTTERFLFEDLQGKKIEADFQGGKVSSERIIYALPGA